MRTPEEIALLQTEGEEEPAGAADCGRAEQHDEQDIQLLGASPHVVKQRGLVRELMPHLMAAIPEADNTTADELMHVFDSMQSPDTPANRLVEAALADNATEIAALLDAGVDVDSVDAFGMTPLMHAAAEGRLEATCLLLHRGADTEARDCDEYTALHHACEAGIPFIVEVSPLLPCLPVPPYLFVAQGLARAQRPA
jgi:hypothetical protein